MYVFLGITIVWTLGKRAAERAALRVWITARSAAQVSLCERHGLKWLSTGVVLGTRLATSHILSRLFNTQPGTQTRVINSRDGAYNLASPLHFYPPAPGWGSSTSLTFEPLSNLSYAQPCSIVDQGRSFRRSQRLMLSPVGELAYCSSTCSLPTLLHHVGRERNSDHNSSSRWL